MTANMYRVGDYVYFETSSTSPYQIRRIEELIKTPNGNVEAKVMCFYRRRDITGSLVMMVDKHQSALEEEQERELEGFSEKERHQMKHREVFLSRQIETLPATHIRGKCAVTLLNETEALMSYLNKDDCFFYSLVYDPTQKTLLADRGEMRVGSRFQAEIQALLKDGEEDGRKMEELESLIYTPNSGVADRQIDQFLLICRSVGTFARALDCSSSVKQPSLHMSAAAASRDITLFHAMDVLHQNHYNIADAVANLVPPSGPVLCRDEMEEWSASEANLFEEALEKYGKDFNDIRQDFLPWKSLKNIIEYYYMWKTTDRYVQQKRVKAVEAESKLKQVYIPNYNNKPGMLNGTSAGESPSATGRPCESCYSMTSSQWYAWGPAHMQCRLCQSCWLYWKKYGGLKYPTRLESMEFSSSGSDRQSSQISSHHRPHHCTITGCGKEFKLKAHLARHCATVHGLAIRSGSPRPIMKTRAAFYLHTTTYTRIARHICKTSVKLTRIARNPFQPLNLAAVKQEYQDKLAENPNHALPRMKPKERGLIVDISYRLGTVRIPNPEWLIPTPKDKIPQPEHLAFPPPPRGVDGQLLIPAFEKSEKSEETSRSNRNPQSPIMLRKRAYEQQNGAPVKRRYLSSSIMKNSPGDMFNVSNLSRSSLMGPLNGRAKVATITRVGGRKQMISWVDAPDDVFFVATDATRRLRRQLTIIELRRAARRPWRRLGSKINYGITPPLPTPPIVSPYGSIHSALANLPEGAVALD